MPSSFSAAQHPLRALSRVVLDDLDGLTDRMMRKIANREPVYAAISTETREHMRAMLRNNLELGLLSLAGDVTTITAPTAPSSETGRLRALQGIPLESVLRAYRLGGQLIWEALLKASREHYSGEYDQALLDASSAIWRLIDNGSAALAEAYRCEQERFRGQEPSRSYAFLNALLEGSGEDTALVREAALSLGVPENGPLLCVVSPLDSTAEEPLHCPGERMDAQGLPSCWHTRPTDVVGLVALGERAPEVALEALRPAVIGRAGVSPVLEHLGSAASAHAMASTAARALRGPGLVTIDQVLPEALLANSPDLVERLTVVAFGDLFTVPPNERRTMLDTLGALIDSNGSAKHAAQQLHCHRNTVLYRLHRIEAVTNRRVSDPHDRMLLALALLALRNQAASCD